MRAQIKLGRVSGIELGLHYSWLIIALLITFSLAAHFRYTNPRWGVVVIWGSAVITSLLFFACLFAHELSHALVGRARKLPVRSITLFALGGVTQVEAETPDASTEFWIGIAGPITSWVLGFILLAIARVGGWAPHYTPHSPVLAILVWLGYINIALGVFNMLPGFPLDGGRVLRAVVWGITGDLQRATRLATRAGQGAALVLILYGIFQFFSGAGLGGLWLTFIGWFLLQAAGASQLQSEATSLLKDLRAEELMSRDCVSLAGDITVQQFVHDYLLRTARRCFVVTEHGRMLGIITPHDIRRINRSRWPFTTIREVMRPLEKVRVISPETPVLKAIELMAHEGCEPVARRFQPARSRFCVTGHDPAGAAFACRVEGSIDISQSEFVEASQTERKEDAMAYVIAQPCIGVKDTACVDACPVDCIHPKKDEPQFETEEMLYISPVECIDCGACVPVCPVSAIFPLDDLPEEWKDFAARNAAYYETSAIKTR